MTRYFDASALVKRYVRENGTGAVRRLLASDLAASSRLSEVEIASGVARRAREGSLTIRQRDRILRSLQSDFQALAIVELVADVTAEARGLLLRHPLRASDAIQLASCLYLQRQLGEPVHFVAFDSRLLDAARAEQLEIVHSRAGAARSLSRDR